MTTCMVVEADDYARNSVADMIISCGLDCVTADSCINGLIACYETMPDIVIVNWMLPDINGQEFLEMLRGMPEGERPHIILCSRMPDSSSNTSRYLESLRDSVVRAAFA